MNFRVSFCICLMEMADTLPFVCWRKKIKFQKRIGKKKPREKLNLYLGPEWDGEKLDKTIYGSGNGSGMDENLRQHGRSFPEKSVWLLVLFIFKQTLAREPGISYPCTGISPPASASSHVETVTTSGSRCPFTVILPILVLLFCNSEWKLSSSKLTWASKHLLRA